jgi:thiosulfate reductase cytochrome b subunit
MSIAEVGVPAYEEILKHPPSFFKNTSIVLIWGMWYVHTFFMFVMLLNFLIAVITNTYTNVIT